MRELARWVGWPAFGALAGAAFFFFGVGVCAGSDPAGFANAEPAAVLWCVFIGALSGLAVTAVLAQQAKQRGRPADQGPPEGVQTARAPVGGGDGGLRGRVGVYAACVALALLPSSCGAILSGDVVLFPLLLGASVSLLLLAYSIRGDAGPRPDAQPLNIPPAVAEAARERFNAPGHQEGGPDDRVKPDEHGVREG